MRRAFISLLCGWLVLPLTSVLAEAPAQNAAALERSLDMLDLEMRLQVLQVYSEQSNFYFPAEWAARYQAEYQALVEQAGQASLSAAGVDVWLAENQKARENEIVELAKLAETHLPKLLKAGEFLVEYRKFELQQQAWTRKRAGTGLEVARFVEGIYQRLDLLAKDRTLDRDGGTNKSRQRWRNDVRRLYRGSIKETDDLVRSIAGYEKQRLKLESYLVFLKEVEKGLELPKAVADPSGKVLELIEERARQKLTTWLQWNYKDIEEDAVKEAFGTVKEKIGAVFGTATSTYSQLKELDNDVVLKGNPTAQATAKRFAILGALYSYTLGEIKDLPGMKALGPLKDFLEFYGEAIALIPVIACKAQALVDKIDQRHRSIRALDAWNITGFEAGQLQQLQVFESFGLQIALDTRIDDPHSANARYFMLVPKDVVPRGWATFNAEQFHRLAQALADERFIHAPDEASRGVLTRMTDSILDWQTTADPLGVTSSAAYLKDLAEKARATPFEAKDLLALAYNQPVTLKGREWTCAQLRDQAEMAMLVRAAELAIRSALHRFDTSLYKDWDTYRDLLLKHGVAFTPQQVLRLFNYCMQSGKHWQHLEKYLIAVGAERAARARGTAQVGVPLVSPLPFDSTLKAGSSVRVVADVIVSGLAPGRTVPGEAVWNFSAWTHKFGPQRIDLSNGVTQLEYQLQIPKEAGSKSVEAKVLVRIPVEFGASALSETSVAIRAGPPRDAPEADRNPVNPQAPATRPTVREFVGRGALEIEPGEVATELPVVSIDSLKLVRRPGAAPVRTIDAVPNAGGGIAMYEGEWPELELRYSVQSSGNRFIEIDVEINGENHAGALGKEEPEKHSRANVGQHVFRQSAAETAATNTWVYKLMGHVKDPGEAQWRKVELARSAALTTTRYPRGWALKEIVRGDKEVGKLTIRRGVVPGFELRKSAELQIDKGAVRALRTNCDVGTDSGKPFEVVEKEGFSIESFPPLLIDGKTYSLTARYLFSREQKPATGKRQIYDVPPICLGLKTPSDCIRIDGKHGWTPPGIALTPKDFSEAGAAAKGKPLPLEVRSGPSSKDTPLYEIGVVFEEDVFRVKPLQQLVTLRYVRLDEFQDGQPMDLGGASTGSGLPSNPDAPPPYIAAVSGAGADGSPTSGAAADAPSYITAVTGLPTDTGERSGGRAAEDTPPRPPVAPPATPPVDPLAVLSNPRPWEDARVKELMNEWLRNSSPDIGPAYVGDTRRWLWSEWAQPHCPPSVVLTDKPEHGAKSREQYVFELAGKLRSRRHYTLREYIERRLRGLSGDKPEEPNVAGRIPTGGGGTATPPKPKGPAVGPAVGNTAPDFTGLQPHNKQFTLAQFRGKPALLMLYAMRDQWTLAGARKLEQIRLGVPDQLKTAAVCIDLVPGDGTPDERARKLGVGFEAMVLVQPAKFCEAYALKTDAGAHPQAILVLDKEGVIRFRVDGAPAATTKLAEFVKIMQELVPGTDWPRVLNPPPTRK